MAGVASHVPGGIGVFESVVIAALPRTVALSDAVTALLLFRLIYFLLPFLVAFATLSAIEAWTATGRLTPAMARLAPVLNAGRAVIPTATGMLVLGSGLFMMFAGLLPNPQTTMEELETFLPLAMLEGGALASSILGSLLIVLALGLLRRSRAAYWLVIGVLGFGIVTAWARTHDPERVVLLALMVAILLPCRREFYRAARLTQGLWSVQWGLFVLSILGAMGLTYYAVHQSAPFRGLMWWQLAVDREAGEAQRALVAASVTLSLGLAFSALRAHRVRSVAPDAEALERARAIIAAHGRGTDMVALSGDKMLMFSPEDDAVLAYGVKGASWIALGAPIGPPAAREDLAWAFSDAARAAGARPVFYEAPTNFTDQAIEMGFSLHKMGEEAVVALAGFGLEGPARKRLRTTHARALRDGLSLEIAAPPHAAGLLDALAAISDGWLARRGAREKRFSVGRFDRAYLQQGPLVLVRHEGRIVAFANLLVAQGQGSAAVDLMRHVGDAPAGVMEFLFTELMLRLRAQGLAEFSLGMAPFAGLTARRGADLWTRFGALVYQYGDRFYNFDGLRRFKAKFDPVWRPRYFCCRGVLPPVAPLADSARLIAGSARGLAAE
jgi:phosphatidylglycerol lysyltransferase